MKKRKAWKKEEFEFCTVCKLNHDQGRRHNFLPKHTKCLSSLLSRFHDKLSDVRFFLNNPSPLRPEHASRNRIWCVFCDLDIHELQSSFASGNAITHLASVEHLKTLKHFLWKYGSGMDWVDAFRISEEDIAEWEKKCATLKIETGKFSGKSHKESCGLSNDIHNRPDNDTITNFDNTKGFNNLDLSCRVTPLQHFTKESYQISGSQCNVAASFQHTSSSSLLVGTHSNGHLWSSNDMTVAYYMIICYFLLLILFSGFKGCGGKSSCYGRKMLVINCCFCLFTLLLVSTNVHDSTRMKYPNDVLHSHTHLYRVRKDGKMVKELNIHQGLQVITHQSTVGVQGASRNVHCGAPPPWFNAVEFDLQSKLGSSLVSSKAGKSQKLNPKRVGAAWAEKRKIELEMEKRGEIVENKFSDDWLPNFGRVWQSGSRKGSRKDFELEKQKRSKAEAQADISIKIQPYISKRMINDITAEP